jgi:hypothetical protein
MAGKTALPKKQTQPFFLIAEWYFQSIVSDPSVKKAYYLRQIKTKSQLL